MKPTEVHAQVHNSQDSDSDNPAKVATKSRKHNIFTNFQNDRNCDVCLRTKTTRHLRSSSASRKVSADHRVLNDGMYNLLCLRSVDEDRQAPLFSRRSGYQEAKTALIEMPKQSRQDMNIVRIPAKERTRLNDKFDPEMRG